MATEEQVVFVDDVDGTPAERTVHFAIDGAQYEIDLSASNARELRAAFAPYLRAARRAHAPGASRPDVVMRGGNRTVIPAARATVAAWARSHGYSLPRSGRIPPEIQDAFDAAQP